MRTILYEIVIFSLFTTFCAILISASSVDDKTAYADRIDGMYELRSTGNLNQNLNGVVNFETAIERTNEGIPFSTLRLKLGCEKGNSNHFIEFLISKENMDEYISKGSYQISKESDGLLHNFDGVFGFADIQELGELPFFANDGEISIDYGDEKRLQGTISIGLSNANGKSIKLNGNFVALK